MVVLKFEISFVLCEANISSVTIFFFVVVCSTWSFILNKWYRPLETTHRYILTHHWHQCIKIACIKCIFPELSRKKWAHRILHVHVAEVHPYTHAPATRIIWCFCIASLIYCQINIDKCYTMSLNGVELQSFDMVLGDRKTPYLHDKNHPINDSKDNWLYEV